MSDIEIKNLDGVDCVKYLPQGVCSKILNLRIQNDTILEIEAIGGCSGNLKGIGMLAQGMNIHEAIKRLQGIPCGSRPTSCPDQISKALLAYVSAKTTANV